MQKFKSVEELVNQLKPEKPVYCIRKNSILSASKFFQNNFPGKILYAVKTNPHPEVIKTLIKSGINQFDVASIEEIKAVRKFDNTAKCSFMHTVKSRESIKEAYYNFGIKTFALDTKDELIKIIETTDNAKDLELFIRVAVSNEHAEIDLSKKFGALNSEASGLLRLAKLHSKKIGLSFHVGSQCMHPISYSKGINEVGNIIKKTKIIPDYINIGGGFPTIYPDLVPLSLESYMEEIKKSLENLKLETFGSLLKKKQVEATEIDENGVVNNIKVKNNSPNFLILHDGEIIVGAKQNRTIDKSVILKPRETRNVDVLCVEKGRWSFRNHEFSQHNSKLSPEIRFSKDTVKNYNKQNTVWNEIDKMYTENNQYSNTSDFCEFKEENSELVIEKIKSKIF